MKYFVPVLFCMFLASDVLRSEDTETKNNDLGTRQDLLFFGAQRPVFLRVHVRLDGKSLLDSWRENVKKSFDYLDVDQDGMLSDAEMARQTWSGDSSTAMAGPGFLKSFFSAIKLPGKPQARQGIGFAEFEKRYRKTNRSFTLKAGDPQRFGGIGLLGRVDHDGDRALSADEYRNLQASLRKLDANDDETISAAELRQFLNPFSQQARVGNRALAELYGEGAIVSLARPYEHEQIALRLISKYSQRRDNAGADLSNATISHLPAEVLDKFDADADGGLTSDELLALLAQPVPDIELAMRIGKSETDQAGVEVLSCREANSDYGIRTASVTRHGIVFVAAGDRLEIQTGRAETPDVKQFFVRQFTTMDKDNNKYLEKTEYQVNTFGMSFDALDRDGDGKLFEEELTGYIQQLTLQSTSRAELTVFDRGRRLFPFFDTDNDRRLTQRELGRDLSWLLHWDENQDGKLGSDEVPRTFHITLTRGQPSRIGGIFFGGGSIVEDVAAAQAASGPSWHRQLDRNADGDVSRREFPGPIDVFERIDSNGDGLIDATEAAAAAAGSDSES